MNWDTAEGEPMDESMGFIFEDPVTYEIMENAVMAPCGHSFSETTVADWHKDDEETTCPVCNTNFYKQDVVPNYKLREAIDRYHKDKEAPKRSGWCGAPTSPSTPCPVSLRRARTDTSRRSASRTATRSPPRTFPSAKSSPPVHASTAPSAKVRLTFLGQPNKH